MSCEGPDCGRALENLYLFIDQEIDDASGEEIKAHIDDCTDCLQEFDLERLVKELVHRSCGEQAPEPLRNKVMMAIRTVQIEIGANYSVTREIRITET
ncbi:hypothetical protein BH09ACT10_BH09ACT10_17730 [soil metagenome]